MKFKEFRLLTEAKKELYAAIGKAPTDALLETKVDPIIKNMHDNVFGVGNHHIEMPLENDLPEKVKSHIESNGDELDGDNVKLKSGRVAPISKYLARSNAPKDVQDEHQNWAKNKIGNSKLVITRHPAEVASASTGTHWSSCAVATKKGSKNHVPAWDAMPSELHNGTLMAMHVHKDAVPDKDGNYASKDVLGRTLIKRHDADIDSENPHEVSFHREDKKYGAFPDSAKKAIDDFTTKNYPQKNLTGHKVDTLYNDDDRTVKVNVNHPDIEHAFTSGHDKELPTKIQRSIVDSSKTPQNILDIAASSNHNAIRASVAKRSTNPDTIRKIFNNPKNEIGMYGTPETDAVRNPHAPKDVLTDGIDHEDHRVREATLSNPNATPEHIMKGLKDRNAFVQSRAADHPTLNKEHVNYIINNDNKKHEDGNDIILGTAMRSAVTSQHATSDQIKNALHNSDKYVGDSALGNKNITKEHLLHALDSPHKEVAKEALKHPLVDHDVLKKAVLNKSPSVVEKALTHDKMTPELFDHARKNSDTLSASEVNEYQKNHLSSLFD